MKKITTVFFLALFFLQSVFAADAQGSWNIRRFSPTIPSVDGISQCLLISLQSESSNSLFKEIMVVIVPRSVSDAELFGITVLNRDCDPAISVIGSRLALSFSLNCDVEYPTNSFLSNADTLSYFRLSEHERIRNFFDQIDAIGNFSIADRKLLFDVCKEIMVVP